MSIQDSILPSMSRPKIKVCIAVPTRDTMHAHFAYCLQALVQYHTQRGIDTVVEFNLGTLVCNQRESLAAIALTHNATHIMWLDSDMMFPRDVCEKLLSHKLAIVACNYSTRALPLKAVAYSEIHDWDTGISKDATGLIPVDGIGFGCILIEADIFSILRKPWFPITYTSSTSSYLGEDMNFCIKARASGFEIIVDTDLSKEVYHIGSAAFLWNTYSSNPGQQTN